MNLKRVATLASSLTLFLCCMDIFSSKQWFQYYRKLRYQPSSSPFRRFYTCSPHNPDLLLLQSIFPELPEPIPIQPYTNKNNYKPSLSTTPFLKDANENDLLLARWLGAEDCVSDGILNFPGTQIYTNTEPYDFQSFKRTPIGQTGQVIPPDWKAKNGFIIVNGMNIQPVKSNQKLLEESGYYDYAPHSFNHYFILGAHADGPHNIRVPLGPLLLVASPLQEHKDLIFNHDLKPRNTGEHFAVFMAHHCVNFRDKAVQKIAQLGTVHIGEDYQTNCIEKLDYPAEGPTPQFEVSDTIGPKTEWMSNFNVYNRYKFAIVMENSYRDGYITEKILMAWLGGAVPIWYGTHQISDIFNEKAFIFYDVENPEAALKQIHFLDTDPDAYEALWKESILKNGQDTIDEYFSFLDGRLKDKIRSTILGSTDKNQVMKMER